MYVRILTEKVMFFWLHPLKHIATSKSSSHVMGGYRLNEPVGGSIEQHDHFFTRLFIEHESMTLCCRRGMPRAARNRYHGMVTLEKMLIIAFLVGWRRQMIPLSVKNLTHARSEVRGV